MFSLSLKDKRFLLIFSILSSLFVIPFIESNFLYSDDLCRVIDPNYTWLWDARILTDILFRILGFGKIINFFPLYHILIIIILTYIGYLLYKLLFYNYSPIISSLFSFILLMNPFVLEEISFQYDGLSMMISILLGILAIKYLFNNNYFLSVIYLVSSLLFYQPNLPFITCILLLKLFFLTFNKKNYSFKLLFKFFLIFLISIMLYYISVSWIPIPRTHSRYDISLWNLFFYIKQIVLNWYFIWFIGFMIMYITIIYSYIKIKKFKISYISLLIFCAFPILLILNAMIPFSVEDPSFVIRVLIGFSGIIFFIIWILYTLLNKISYRISNIFLIGVVFYLVSMSFAYNQVQRNQKDFLQSITDNLIRDIINEEIKIDKLLVIGNPPYSPFIHTILQQYPYFKFYNITKQGISSSNWRTTCYIKHFPILKIDKVLFSEDEKSKAILKKAHKQPALKENPIYTLKVVEDTAIVEFKERNNEKD